MRYWLAQVNIARMKAPIDDPIMRDFVNNLDRINALAESSEGFIWRLKGEEDNALAIKVFEDDRLIINMSVWKNIDLLFNFTYNSKHIEVFKRRKEWFDKLDLVHMVMWYIEEGSFPTPSEAKEKLAYLGENGETPKAFTFRKRFTVEDYLRDL